jgi:hypothetical protein
MDSRLPGVDHPNHAGPVTGTLTGQVTQRRRAETGQPALRRRIGAQKTETGHGGALTSSIDWKAGRTQSPCSR